jgi:hypothetical protein
VTVFLREDDHPLVSLLDGLCAPHAKHSSDPRKVLIHVKKVARTLQEYFDMTRASLTDHTGSDNNSSIQPPIFMCGTAEPAPLVMGGTRGADAYQRFSSSTPDRPGAL